MGSRLRSSTSCRASGRSSPFAFSAKTSCCSETTRAATACSSAPARTAGPTSPSAGWSRVDCAARSTAGCSTSRAGAWKRRQSPKAAACAPISGRRPIRWWRKAGSCSPIWLQVMRRITLRRISGANTHVRVTNLVFPHGFVSPMSSEMTITQWHVPIDDHRHYWYAIFTSFGAAVNKDEMRRQRLELYELPDYVPRKNKSNDYGFDPHEQEQVTFTGMGTDINVHDQWACESMGSIQDRSKEHLGQSDKAISAYRRILRGAIEEAARAGKPMMVLDPAAAAKINGPAAIDGIGPSEGWQAYWRKTDPAPPQASLLAPPRPPLPSPQPPHP